MEIFPEYTKYRRSSYCSNNCSPNHCCGNGCFAGCVAPNRVLGQGCSHYYCNFHYTNGAVCCSMSSCHFCCKPADMKKEKYEKTHYACYSCVGKYS